MVQRIFQIILPVFAIVAGGWLYGRRHRPDTAAVNRMNMDVFVPALVLSALTSKDFDLWQNRALILASLGVVLGSGLVAWPLSRLLRVEARTFVPSMMFNNCGNMGLPLALLAFGEKWLPAAVALFVTSNLLHFTLGTRLMRREADLRGLARSPVVIATAAGALLSALAWRPPEWIALPLHMVGDVAVPLMLFALGVRMIDVPMTGWRLGLAGAAVRPLAGLLAAIPLGRLLHLEGTPLAMLYLFASLPPAVLNFLFAEQYRQEPETVASIVLIGHLASLVFVPLGLWLGLRALG